MSNVSSKLQRAQSISFIVGILFAVLSGIGAATNRPQFFISYLWAFLFWIGLSIGCLNVAMIHYLTGSHWGAISRRFLEAGFLTLPLMALLFVPRCFGARDLYPWARSELVAGDKILQHRQTFQNVPAFALRSVVLFAIWIALALRLRKWSLLQDSATESTPTRKLKTWSGPGVAIVPLTMTFALIDWVMAIETKWSSTIFPLIILAGQVLAAFAFITILVAWLRDELPFRDVVREFHFHDLGNLLLAFVMFWTYVSFSQFLIIYSGNLPREIEWYLHRVRGGWQWVVVFLALFHFFMPFLLLLSRKTKKSVSRLVVLAALVLFAHVVADFWAVAPTFHPGNIAIRWQDFVVWIALGGLWLTVFFRNLNRHPLLAANDPTLGRPRPETDHAK